MLSLTTLTAHIWPFLIIFMASLLQAGHHRIRTRHHCSAFDDALLRCQSHGSYHGPHRLDGQRGTAALRLA